MTKDLGEEVYARWVGDDMLPVDAVRGVSMDRLIAECEEAHGEVMSKAERRALWEYLLVEAWTVWTITDDPGWDWISEDLTHPEWASKYFLEGPDNLQGYADEEGHVMLHRAWEEVKDRYTLNAARMAVYRYEEASR